MKTRVAKSGRRRRARIEALRGHGEDHFKELVESSSDIMSTLDRTGIVRYVNRSAELVLGQSRDRFIGHKATEFVHVDDRCLFDRLFTQVVASPGGASEGEIRAVDAAGTTRYMHVVLKNHLDASLGVILANASDVTEARNAEIAMERYLRTSDRIITVGLLAAGVAHEINNPLSALIGNLFFLSEELPSCAAANTPIGNRISRLLHDANEAAERLRLIARDIRMFARDEGSARVLLSVESLLESSLRLTRHEIHRHARLRKNFQATPRVYANEASLGQVFVNLLINAAQAIPEGNAEQNEICVATGVDARGSVFVEVRDTGIGILPDVLPRIFDPFFTTKPVGVGTGLGLAIAQSVVRGLGGTITVHSRLGEGSVVRVSLPAHQSEPTTTTRAPAGAKPRGRAGGMSSNTSRS